MSTLRRWMRLLERRSPQETPSWAKHYKKKKSGGRRVIHSPNKPARALQKKLLRFLRRDRRIDFESATAVDVGAIRNARRHRNQRFFFSLDISNAYPSVSAEMLTPILARLDDKLGSFTEIKQFIRRYCCSRGGKLAQGLNAVPYLFELYCKIKVDQAIESEIYQYPGNILYTRYVDDLVVSSHFPIPRRLIVRIREILKKAGFAENHWKTQILSLEKTPSIVITGISLDRFGRMAPTRRWLKSFNSLLWAALQIEGGGGKKVTNRVQGKINYYLDVLGPFPRNLSPLEQKVFGLYSRWAILKGFDTSRIAEVLTRSG